MPAPPRQALPAPWAFWHDPIRKGRHLGAATGKGPARWRWHEMLIHGSAAAWGSEAVLFRGPSGAGKSDLVLRLIGRGWHLVADDQVMLEAEALSAPPALRGMLEIRGLGIFTKLPVATKARLCLMVDLVAREDVPRLPEPAFWQGPTGTVPRITLHAFEDSACDKVIHALGAAAGRLSQRAGAFAA